MNFLFIYINCLFWPDLTYLGGTAEIKDASILHAENARGITCLNALTYAVYIKINTTHWYCGPIRVKVLVRFLSGRILVLLYGGKVWNVFALRFECLMDSELFPVFVPGVLDKRQNPRDVV